MQHIFGKKSRRIPSLTSLALVFAAFAVFAVVACGNEGDIAPIQQSNTYPLDFFSEMHYSPAHRPQEPSDLAPDGIEALPGSVPVASPFLGDPTEVLEVNDIEERAYDPNKAGELYSINCSFCHGLSGQGDGTAAAHMTSPNSAYAQRYGEPFKGPANLIEVRGRYENAEQVGVDYFVSTMFNGVCSALPNSEDCITIMPAFVNQISEEDIRDIAAYVFDEQRGLGSSGR